MKIGDRITQWFNTTSPFKEFINWNSRLDGRIRTLKQYMTDNSVFSGLFAPINYTGVFFAYAGYVLFGLGIPSNYFIDRRDNTAIDNISKEIGSIARQSATSPATKEILELMGAIISDPLVGFLNSYAGKDNIDSDEFIRGFYGTLMSVPLIGGSISTMGELLTGGQVDNLGKPINDAYFTLGLGFVGWQGISPLLTESVLQSTTRNAKKRFRQTRFKGADLLELYRYGRIDINEALEGLRFEGWRDSDLDKVIFLARTHLTRSDILEMLEQGKIDDTQAAIRLRKLGYSVEDSLTIIMLHKNKKSVDGKAVSLASAKKAFKLGIINEQKFTEYLAALNYDLAAIALEISILKFDKEVEEKELSVSQIRTAYMNNVITHQEVDLALTQLNYGREAIITLLDTWKAQKAPKILRLNKGNILQAMIKGVISSDIAMSKLLALNYSQDEARIAIETVSVQTGINIKQISEAKILQAYQEKIISQSDALNRLIQRKYSNSDATLLLQLADTVNKIDLSTNDVLDAYLFGAIGLDQTKIQLQTLGATQSFIDTRIATIDKRREREKAKPSTRDISVWLRGGLISEDQARLKLQEIGFNSDDSALFIQAVSIAPARSLSDTNIVDAINSGVIDTSKGLELFRGIGLSQSDAQLRIDTIAKQREFFKPKVSPTTLVSAARDEIITLDELKEKLAGMGFDEANIQLYVDLASFENATQEIKLSKGDILKAYRKGFMSQPEAMSLLEGKGYSLEESALLLAMENRDIEVTETYQLLSEGSITADEAIDLFIAEGYSQDDILDVFERLGIEEIQ